MFLWVSSVALPDLLLIYSFIYYFFVVVSRIGGKSTTKFILVPQIVKFSVCTSKTNTNMATKNHSIPALLNAARRKKALNMYHIKVTESKMLFLQRKWNTFCIVHTILEPVLSHSL
jgi:hypothetical protein